MAVSNTSLRSPVAGGYACNGVTVNFAGTFRLLAATDVNVILADSDSNETVLTLTTEYTVSPTGGSYPADAFTVTTVATYDSEYTISLTRDMTLTQPTAYGNQGPYLPANHETSYDRNLLLLQQQQEVIDRCVKNSASATAVTDPDSYLAACQSAQAAAETAETGAEAALAQVNAEMPLNTQTGTTYVLVASDLGNTIRMTSSSGNVITITTDVVIPGPPPFVGYGQPFSVGATMVIRQSGTGATAIEAASGVTLNGVDGGRVTLLLQFGDAMLQKVDTNAWEVSGPTTDVA